MSEFSGGDRFFLFGLGLVVLLLAVTLVIVGTA